MKCIAYYKLSLLVSIIWAACLAGIVAAPLQEPSCLSGQHIQYEWKSVCYVEEYRQSEWVSYMLTSSMFQEYHERTNNFRADPNIVGTSPALEDYRGSGYDRGHLAPAADMAGSYTAMSESFFLTNISPQLPAHNRGVWSRLESLVRAWGQIYDTIYVATGPVLHAGLPAIGSNSITIPELFYKAVLVHKKDDKRMIGFLVRNEGSQANLESFVVSVDSIARLTNIDLFHHLSEPLKTNLKGNPDLEGWDFTARPAPRGSPANSTAVQCSATTQKGEQCKRTTSHKSGNCWQHQTSRTNQKDTPEKERETVSNQCTAKTQAGNRCKRMTRNSSGKCWQHE